MLGKLMKYEFKSTGRIYLPLFAALLIVSFFNRIFIVLNLSVPKIIGSTVSGFMMGAVLVIALILTIQRFSKNLLSREGYLMFTLPVSTDSLIWSKLLVASVWTIACCLVVLAAVAIMAVTGQTFESLRQSISEFFRSLSHFGVNGALAAVESIIAAVATLFTAILMLYVCMAMSLLVNRHRVGFAFLIYIIISVIGQTIIGVFATSVDYSSFITYIQGLSGFGQFQMGYGIYFLSVSIVGIIFYIVTRYMLKNKLNLE